MSSSEYFKDYYQRNREKYLARAKRWKKNNPEARKRHIKAHSLVRRACKVTPEGRAKELWRAARKRGKEFKITIADVETLLRATPTCPYTLQPIDMSVSKTIGWKNPWGPSLDRIDSSKGYVPDNIEITSVWWNIAKSEWAPDVMALAIAGLTQK